MCYLYVLAQLLNHSCNGLDMVFQQLPGSGLPVLITCALLEVGDDVVLDSEGLVEEEGRGPLLAGEPLLQPPHLVSGARSRGHVSPANTRKPGFGSF